MDFVIKIFTHLVACVLIHATFFTLPVSAGVENTGSGLLQLHTQAPMQSLRMVMPLVSAGSVNPGWGTSLTSTWTNVWADNTYYSLDYEMLDNRVTIAYGVNESFGVSLIYDERKYFGGRMDHLIEGFHDVFGISQGDRDLSPRGEGQVVRNGTVRSGEKADMFNNNGVTMSLSYDLTGGDGIIPAVNLTAAVRYGIESGDFFTEEHPLDYGFSLGLAKRWTAKTYSHVILSYTIYDFDRSRDVPGLVPVIMEEQQFGGLFSFGYEYSERTTILLQYVFNAAAVTNISGLDEDSHEVALGFKYRTESVGVIEFGLLENIVNYDNSPDFGLHLGWSIYF